MEDNFNHRKWFKDQYLKEDKSDNDKVVAATKDGKIEITAKQMERLHNGEVVHLSNGSVLSFVKEANINEEMTPSEEAFKAILDVAANMKGKMDDHYIELLGKAHDSLRAEMDDLKRDAISNMMGREKGA